MTQINEFNITEEELKEIEEITELANGCTEYFLESLIDPNTQEKVELGEEDKKAIFKLVLHKTMDYIEENEFPNDEEKFNNYVSCIFNHLQENLI